MQAVKEAPGKKPAPNGQSIKAFFDVRKAAEVGYMPGSAIRSTGPAAMRRSARRSASQRCG
jgi:hypothetical protein